MEDIEMLGELFMEELIKIKAMLDDGDDDEEIVEDEENEDDASEYSEAYGGKLSERIKEYREKLRDYAKTIKEGLESAYRGAAKAEKAEETHNEELKSPWERGHKMGCGCPGCTKFREFYGINVVKKTTDHQKPSNDFSPLTAVERIMKKDGYVEKTDSRPCGGRHYHHFHGKDANLKGVLGNYTGRMNFSTMGY